MGILFLICAFFFIYTLSGTRLERKWRARYSIPSLAYVLFI